MGKVKDIMFCPILPVTGYRIIAGVRAAVDLGDGKRRHMALRTLDHVIVMNMVQRSISPKGTIINTKHTPPKEFM